MRIEQLPALFEPARPILATIEEAGFEAYFVGGCVRDLILHDPIHDIDIATSAYPAEIKQLFHRTVDTGIEHGTVMILDHGTGYETTTFRTESGYQDYRRPDSVTFVRSLSEDLQRRDFTINALAMKEDGEIVDLFDGLGDLKRRVIKAVGDPNERFLEDALRMMRAVRFASKLDFEIDAATLAGIQRHAPLLAKIAVERVQVEFEKLLLGQNPTRGLRSLITTDLYRYCPGLAKQRDALCQMQDYNWQLTSAPAAWVLLAWQLKIPDSQAAMFFKAWKLSNQLIKQAQKALRFLRVLSNNQIDNQALFMVGKDALTIAIEVAKTVGLAVDEVALQAQYQQLPIHDLHELAITGGDLIKNQIITPGPQMGKLLVQIQQAVIAGQLVNEPTSLLNFARQHCEL